MLDDLYPVQCKAKGSTGTAIKVVFNTMSGVTWIPHNTLRKLEHRLFKMESAVSMHIAPFGQISVNQIAKFHVSLESDVDPFDIEIQAIVLGEEQEEDMLVVGVDTMWKEGVIISLPQGVIAFRDGKTAMERLSSFAKIRCNTEFVGEARLQLLVEPSVEHTPKKTDGSKQQLDEAGPGTQLEDDSTEDDWTKDDGE